MTTPTLKPGIHSGITFAEYHAIDAANCSTLKLFRRTPAHARYEIAHPDEPTDALRTGDAAHVAILQPDLFGTQFAKMPKFDRRTIKGKADTAAWEADHPNVAAITADEYDLAVAMRDAVWAHPTAGELLRGKGQNELTAIWTDEPTGLLCKGRMDRFTSYRGWSAVVDVKTARDASGKGFGKAVIEYGYHWQAAFYLDGLSALTPKEKAVQRRFIFVVVEKDPPHCVALWELDEPAVEEGRMQYRRALDRYAECKKSGEWPGYPQGIDALDIPKYAYELAKPD